MIQTYLQIVID